MYVLLRKRDFFFAYQLIPIAIFVLLFAFYSIDKFILSIIFFTPIAVTLKELGFQGSVDLSLPTEPLMATALLLMIVYQLKTQIFDKALLKHPITIILGLQLLWILFTCITSEMPLVSIKFFLARLWFIATAYFLCAWIFKNPKHMFNFLLCYTMPFIFVMLYTLYQHSLYEFNEESSHWVASPFYNDHTAYGAALGMFVPIIIAFIFQKNNIAVKGIFIVLTIIIITATIYSFARGAWASLAAAVCIFVTLLFRIRFSWLLSAGIVLLSLFFVFQTQILLILNKNDTDSEKDLSNNVESMSNISTDASNLERLNRWSCAIEMFKERPVLGWGPGTYMFQYAPFQKASEKSYISVSDGSNGNSHSEYLGPLAEQGIPGLAIVSGLLLAVFFMGYRLCYTIKESKYKILAYSVFLGLVTYFTHGFINNFLDTDKLAVPFFGFISILVSLDVYGKQWGIFSKSE